MWGYIGGSCRYLCMKVFGDYYVNCMGLPGG